MILIKDNMTTDSSLSVNGYITYVSILMILKKDRNLYYINSNMLSYYLTNTFKTSKLANSSINTGLDELIKLGMIKEIESTKSRNSINEWLIDVSDIIKPSDKKEYYTLVDEKEIHSIFTEKNISFGNSITLLRFYVYLLSTLHKTKKDEKYGVGFTKMENMIENYGLSKSTIIRYQKRLEKLKLLYIYRPKESLIYDNGTISEVANTYGRLEDREKINKLGCDFVEKYKDNLKRSHRGFDKNRSYNTRGYSQKYARIIKAIKENKGIPYEIDECKDIYFAMLEYNQRYNNEPSRQKDLSIFSKFDFYKE